MALATTEELRRYLRHSDPWTPDEEATAQLLLDLATGAVEDECGQPLAEGTDTYLVDALGTRRLVLPRWPLTAVDQVLLTETGDVLAEGDDFTWSRSGILYRRGTTWPCAPQAVDVTVTAGWNPVPDGPRGIVLRLAASAWDNAGGALSSETLGDHSVSYADPASAGIVLSDADRRALGRYGAPS